MLGGRPPSPGADSEPCSTPQPQEPSPDERRDLEEPPATPGLDEPDGPSSDVPTSVVYLEAGSAVQLRVNDVDLLLEPNLTSVLEVEFPEHTVVLVPEGLQAPDHLGEPGFFSASPQGGAGLEMPEDDILVLPPGASCQFILENSYEEEFFDEDEDSGPPSPWMDSPGGQALRSPGLS